MHTLSHRDTLGLESVLELGGDLLMLPQEASPPYAENKALVEAGVIEPGTSVIHKSVMELFRYQGDYRDARAETGIEPSWVRDLPQWIRVSMRLNYALLHEEPLAIMPALHAAGISYMVREGGLCEDLFHTFKLARLQHIRQLGFLNRPNFGGGMRIRESLSDHTRWTHSLDVMAIGTLIGTNLELEQPDFNELRTLCLTHDTLTPAGGDSVKMVDLAQLDEDDNYPAFLKTLDMERLRSKYGIRQEVLVEGIRNEGCVGEILDMADKIAYIARDLQKCQHHIETGYLHQQPGMKTLVELLVRTPDICSLWDSIALQNGRPVFTDTKRLIAFLKARLLMFRELYFHPTARFGDFLMSRLFVKVLMQKKALTKEMLLELTDDGLHAILDDAFGIGVALDTCSSHLARCDQFKTLEEGQEFARSLRDSGNAFVMLDDNRRAIKTGADMMVWGEDGPMRLRESDPGSARELDEMATMLRLVHVYHLDGDPLLSREVLLEFKRQLV